MTVNSRALFLVVSVAVPVVCSAAMPYERYQSIVDRKPFGPEPVNFDPEAAPGSAAANAAALAGGEMTAEQRTVEEQQMAANVRVSMINVTPAGAVAVGFTDSSVQPAENYYLIVGRSQNGWTVKSADPATESVTLEKGGIEVTVKLGETSGGGKGANARGANRLATLRAGKSPVARQADEAPAAIPPRLGGMARLRQRRAEMQAKARAAEEKKAQAAAAEAAAREEREAKEAEEKQARAEQEAREAEERAQQRETLRQIQEQLRRDRESKDAAQQQSEEGQEE
jgi:flagellar biosynthesis GTPase FlhF